MDLEMEKMPLNEIAINYPEVIPVLEKYHIDYSCHGELSLEKACFNAGVYSEMVEKELVEIATSNNPENIPHIETWTIQNIVKLIKNEYHSYFISTVPVITRLVSIGCLQLENGFPKIKRIKSILSWIENELDFHLLQEREILFPALQKLLTEKDGCKITLEPIINEIKLEFEDLHFGFEEIRNIYAQIPPLTASKNETNRIFDKLAEFEEKTNLYLHIGQNILFPKIILLEKSLVLH